MVRVPGKNDRVVQAFCRRLVVGGRSQYVPVRPVVGEPVDECFTIVPKQVAAHGGEQHIGWAIWIWPGVFIEAEFHAIWKRPDGRLVDVTRKARQCSRVLFLKDPSREYEGVQVDNIRRALNNDPQTLRFIELAHARFLETNRGDLADYHGTIKLESHPRLWEILDEMHELEHALVAKYG